jgi:hypothetical protein
VKTSFVILTAAILAAATTAEAQGRGKGKGNSDSKVPPGHRPPAGMCRIWINGVPPGRQPAPTDCQTAVRNQPPNSQIIWGDNTRRGRDVYDDDRRTRDRDYDRDRDRTDDRDRDRDRDRNGGVRRDSHGHSYDPSCIDNDRNGWCDYHPEMRSGAHVGDYPNTGSSGGSVPVDRGQYPSTMPAMTGATLIRVGVRTKDVENWLGRSDLRSETSDSNGDGVPEIATWYDRSNGTILQVWRDDDRDGRADSVEIYRNGQRVQVVR